MLHGNARRVAKLRDPLALRQREVALAGIVAAAPACDAASTNRAVPGNGALLRFEMFVGLISLHIEVTVGGAVKLQP